MFPLKDDNPTKTRPYVTYAMIIVNTAIFALTLALGIFDQTIDDYGVRPSEILAGRQLHTLVTSMFLHGGILHILFNMWYLWIFADNLEDDLGHSRFLIFYFAVGLAATFVDAFTDPASTIPRIGASGAISGVLGAYLLLYPFAKVHTAIVLFLIIQLVTIPAIAMIGFWFILQLISASYVWLSGVSTGTAYMAHIGGFLAGLLFILPFRLKRGKKRGRVSFKYNSHYY